MKKQTHILQWLFLVGLLAFSMPGYGQIKPIRSATGLVLPVSELEPVVLPASVPQASPSLQGGGFSRQPLGFEAPVPGVIRLLARDDQGLPIWAEIAYGDPDGVSLEAQASRVLSDMAALMKIRNAQEDLSLKRIDHRSDGEDVLVFEQQYKGVVVDGAEIRLYARDGRITLFSGRYFPSPALSSVQPVQTAAEAVVHASEEVGARDLGGLPADYLPELPAPQLTILHRDGQPVLVWKVELMANALHRWTVYIDAKSGDVVHKRAETCSLTGLHHHAMPVLDGPFTANAVDLKGVNRLINTYQVGNTYYLLDGSRPMFKPGSSMLPDDPVGGILTIDALNTSPAQNSFKAAHVTSSNNLWNKPVAVSAHYNAGIAYEYYRQTFNRNSISGTGKSIMSFVNVADDDGGGMDNAFWNGAAMFYGNGDQAFLPLARSLDVAGHEMTHGVIQATANLVYEKESGALNESFADIFATMIDRDDWKIGEEVVKASVFPSGALRDLQDPHNGGSGLGSPGWQPKNTSEQYNGSQDNGGVHINSGIPNHAFYLFASNAGVTKEQAEQVFYLALDKYLVKSSKFIDLRYAVIQACKDLYGAGTPLVGIAENAFNAVGIGSGNTGGGTPDDYQDDINVNPGEEYLVFRDDPSSKLYISSADGSGIQVLSNVAPKSRPSVTDDGSLIVFVGLDNKMHAITIDWSTGQPTESIIQNQPIWHNVAISKDGLRIAGIADDIVPEIEVFDFNAGQWNVFGLYNPTFAEGVVTNEVRYADAMEFDHSGNYLVYDAYNLITNESGDNFDYWDIGFLDVWDPATNDFASGEIFKLFSSVPDLSSVANPTFAKNSSYILAFDFYDGQADAYYIMGVNLESGDIGQIYENNTLGYPNYSVHDDQLIFDAKTGFFLDQVLGIIDLNSNKITGISGTDFLLINGGARGNWFANGVRPLTGTNEPETVDNPFLYPNPGTNSFIPIGVPAGSTIRVWNALGSEILRVTEWQEGQAIEMGDVTAGIYYIQMVYQGKTASQTWIKSQE
ncbi:MAG: M4 family metallopeptidase [Saprospiraceae bacterium]